MPPLRTGIGSIVVMARPANWAIQLGELRLEAADLAEGPALTTDYSP